MSEATRGQQNRKEIRQRMESLLPKFCPDTFSGLANSLAYELNLTPDTIKYNYLNMF
jgi:hypothetical protein